MGPGGGIAGCRACTHLSSCLIPVIQEMGLKLSEFHPLTVKSGTITGRISATNGEYAHSKTEQYWKGSRGAECGYWVSLRMCESGHLLDN